MASLRNNRRRLLRWRRYADKTCWNPRVTRPAWMGLATAITDGHQRAWDAAEAERQRRADLAERRWWLR
jgi:hypothetical protein